MRPVFCLAILAGCVATAAMAQDIGPALNPTTMIGYAGVVTADKYLKQGQFSKKGQSKQAARPAMPSRAFSRPAPSQIASSRAYPSPSQQMRGQVLSDYLARARRRDAAGAASLEAQLKKYDYAAIYDGVTRPYGLAGNDAAKSLAAYMMLGWTIVNDGADPPAGAIRGVQAQAAQALADPRLSAPDTIGMVGEEFKLLFVTLHAGWQGARREGTVSQYARGVEQLFRQQNGIDLAKARLGPGGFMSGLR